MLAYIIRTGPVQFYTRGYPCAYWAPPETACLLKHLTLRFRQTSQLVSFLVEIMALETCQMSKPSQTSIWRVLFTVSLTNCGELESKYIQYLSSVLAKSALVHTKDGLCWFLSNHRERIWLRNCHLIREEVRGSVAHRIVARL